MNRLVMVRALAVLALVAALAAALVSNLWATGHLPAFLFGKERYFATLRQYWQVPAEFWLALSAMLLVALSQRAQRHRQEPVARAHAFAWSIVLLGMSAGMLAVYPFTVTLWIVALCALAIFYVSSETIVPLESLRLIKSDFRGRTGPGAWTPTLIIGLGAVVIAQALHARVAAYPRDEANKRALTTLYMESEPLSLPDLIGSTRARLVVFTDYQCPSCSALVPLYRSAVSAAQLKGQAVELIVRDFPLEPECNQLVKSPTHPMACEAAVAARLVRARSPSESDGFESWLYSQQASLTRESLLVKMATLRLDDLFRESYATLLDAVREDAAFGARAGVYATPTLFLEGVKLPSVTPTGLETLFAAVVPLRTQ